MARPTALQRFRKRRFEEKVRNDAFQAQEKKDLLHKIEVEELRVRLAKLKETK